MRGDDEGGKVRDGGEGGRERWTMRREEGGMIETCREGVAGLLDSEGGGVCACLEEGS